MTTAISLRNVVKTFGPTRALDDLDLEVATGEVHAYLRGVLSGLFDESLAESIRIQYGGSVKPENVSELMAVPDVDGALVGGASLKADSFLQIVHYG